MSEDGGRQAVSEDGGRQAMSEDGGRQTKTALFDGFARIGRALASGRRLELMDLLAQGERSVDELAAAAGLSSANASQHLQVLRGAGLVASRQDGVRVYYRLASPRVVALLDDLREVAYDRSAEVRALAEEYLGGDVEPVDREQLERLLEEEDIVVVDVRPRDEFAAGHIDHARSIPLDELRERLSELPDDRLIVAYCRGRFCAYSHDAVRLLEESGRRARRLEDGFPEWQLAGLPSVRGGGG
ncbi:MAG: ArsR/SmtB family transcription factor [Nitriliruptorales bacterium]